MSKRFDAATVRTNYRSGRPVGSVIKSRYGTFELPHWPPRIRNVREEPAMGLIVVETDQGHRHFLGADDAISESSAGGSEGGHDPKAHGKIRFIVRAFGKWAEGKHEVCVRRIRTEHPEIVKGRNVNALCAWLKDQWAGTTKWRGRKSDPKQRAEGEAIMRRASATAPARFAHAMPVALDDGALDALVEDVRTLTGMEPRALLIELGGAPDDVAQLADDEVFEALYDAEVDATAALIAETELQLAHAWRTGQGHAAEALVEVWLALHGDPAPIDDDPASVADALSRIASGTGPLTMRSSTERRIAEALALPAAVEPDLPVVHPSPRSSPAKPASLMEAGAVAGDDPFGLDPEVLAEGFDALYGRAVGLLQEAELDTFERRRALAGATPNELARTVEQLTEAMQHALCGHRYRRGAKACPHCGEPMIHEAHVEDGIARVVERLARADADWAAPLAELQREWGYALRGEAEAGAGVLLTHASYPTVAVRFGPDAGVAEVTVESEVAADEDLEEGSQVVRVSGYTTRSGKRVGSYYRGRVGGRTVRSERGESKDAFASRLAGMRRGAHPPERAASGPSSPARSSSGRLRNVSSMSDAKLQALGHEMRGHADKEGVGHVGAEMRKRGLRPSASASRAGHGAPTRPGRSAQGAVSGAPKTKAQASRMLDDLFNDDVSTGRKHQHIKALHTLSDEQLRSHFDKPDLTDLANAADDIGSKGMAARIDKLLKAPKAAAKPKAKGPSKAKAALQRLEGRRFEHNRQQDVLDDLAASGLSEKTRGEVDDLNSPLARMIRELQFFDVQADRVFSKVLAARKGEKDPVRSAGAKAAAKARRQGYSTRWGPPPLYDADAVDHDTNLTEDTVRDADVDRILSDVRRAGAEAHLEAQPVRVRQHIRTGPDGRLIAVSKHERGGDDEPDDTTDEPDEAQTECYVEMERGGKRMRKAYASTAKAERHVARLRKRGVKARVREAAVDPDDPRAIIGEALEQVDEAYGFTASGRGQRGRAGYQLGRSHSMGGRTPGGFHGRPIARPQAPHGPAMSAGYIGQRGRGVKGFSAGGVSAGTGTHRAGGSVRVRRVQSYLHKLGYAVGKSDGVFGNKTTAAVKAFQQKHGLKVDGVVGARTLRAMRYRRIRKGTHRSATSKA